MCYLPIPIIGEVRKIEDTIKQALSDTGEDANTQSVPPTDEQQAPETDTESNQDADATAEDQGHEETGSEDSPKKGAQSRIREVVKERNLARERNETLQRKIEELTGGSSSNENDYTPYTPQVAPGQEISREQYQQDIARTADSIVKLRMKQNEVKQKMITEAAQSMSSYDELNPETESFDKDLNDSISQAVTAYMFRNPTASLKGFVDKLMKPYRNSVAKTVEKKVDEETANVTKRVAETALRPTTSRGSGRKFEELSIKEMEDKLGTVR